MVFELNDQSRNQSDVSIVMTLVWLEHENIKCSAVV